MNYGIIEGLVNGVSQVVFDHEVTGSAVSSVSTGNILNGDEDGWYTIIARIIDTSSGSSFLRFNADSGTNYGYRGMYAASTTVGDYSETGRTGILTHYSATANVSSFAVIRVYAKSGSVRLANSFYAGNISTTTVTEIAPLGQVWNNSADNIVSASFIPAGTFAVGTRIIILKSNNFANGTPTGIITTPQIKGAWVRVGSRVLDAPESSVTFPDLDGDTAVLYYLSISAKEAVAQQGVNLQFNADGGSNYGRQFLKAISTTISAARGTGEAAITALNDGPVLTGDVYLQFQSIIFAKSGFVRPVISYGCNQIKDTQCSAIETVGGVWSNTEDNITEIKASYRSNGYAAGSTFDLYALYQ